MFPENVIVGEIRHCSFLWKIHCIEVGKALAAAFTLLLALSKEAWETDYRVTLEV